MKPQVLAMASLVAMLASPALANPVLSAGSQASAGSDSATPYNSSSGSPATYVSSYSSISNDAGNAYSASFANQYGAYAVRAQTEGISTGEANTSLLYSFTNTGAAQGFSLSFYLYGGAIGHSLAVDAGLIDDESLLASYAASIKVNGIERFASSATLSRDVNGITLAKTGVDLNDSDDGSDGVYDWDAASFVIDLGFLDTGESVDILAELVGTSYANVGTYAFDSCSGGYSNYGGYGGYGGYGACFKGSSFVNYGDPLEIFGDGSGGEDAQPPFAQAQIRPNDVPEPGALALVGLALAGLAATSRRRPR